jgi:hypothetical protein
MMSDRKWNLTMDARVKFTAGLADGQTRLPAHDNK